METKTCGMGRAGRVETGLWTGNVKNKWKVQEKDTDMSFDEAQDLTVPQKIKKVRNGASHGSISPLSIGKEKKQFHERDQDLWSEMEEGEQG